MRLEELGGDGMWVSTAISFDPLLSCVQCLQCISTVKGQLVVLECRICGTPPLQILWYRENEQIVESADFHILRKSK